MAEQKTVPAVFAAASFGEGNPFGLVVNGEQNNMLIEILNSGDKNYTVVSASASYHDQNKDWKLVKNATVTKLNIPLNTGKNVTAPYRLNSEFRPQELGLTVWVDLKDGKELTRITAFNQTVNIVEPAQSWFDPQVLFMYIIVGAALLGGAYYAFQSYFVAPQQKKKRRGGKRAAAPVEPTPVAVSGKGYEEDWIPAAHLKKKTGKGRSDGEGFTSGGEATSGAEASGPEGKTRRRKSRK